MKKKWFEHLVTVGPGQSNGDAASNGGHAAEAPAGDLSSGSAMRTASAASSNGSPAQDRKQSPAKNAGPSMFKSVDGIYAEAQLPNSERHYTCVKIAQMLRSDHLRNMNQETKRSAIMLALEANGTPVQQVVEDGVQRERALEQHLRSCEKTVDDFEKQKERENAQLQEQLKKLIEEHTARIQANNDEVGKRKAAFLSWRLELQEEQQRINQALRQLTGEERLHRSETKTLETAAAGV